MLDAANVEVAVDTPTSRTSSAFLSAVAHKVASVGRDIAVAY